VGIAHPTLLMVKGFFPRAVKIRHALLLTLGRSRHEQRAGRAWPENSGAVPLPCLIDVQ